LVVMVAMIAVNAVFAAYEIALASVSLGRLELLVHENRRGAKAALHMKQNVEASLATVQLGLTLVMAIAAATGGAGAGEQLAPAFQRRLGMAGPAAHLLAIAAVVVPLTVVTIMFGELVPKVFSLRNKEWVYLRLSPAMQYFSYSVWPAVWLLENSATAIMKWGEGRWRPRLEGSPRQEAAALQELRACTALARMSRLIGHQEERIIMGAARLSARPVKEIMLAADGIRMMYVGDSLADCLVQAHLDMHTRFPVTERRSDPQGIIGYVNFKDIVALMRLAPKGPSLIGITRLIPSYTEETSIAVCLENLIRDYNHIALIRNAAGQVVGMITIEDIIEELVGDIMDEYDRLPHHSIQSGQAWVVGGGITLDRLKDISGFDLAADPPAQGAKTLNEWIRGHLGHGVEGGEVMERGGYRVVIRKVRRQMVLEAQVGKVAG
ncbi:MAG TPA: hemolysin family protein, partial [Terriglobales bacterium]|nr:hemolysin family protein [Terriglobales bacterium]